MSEFMACHVRDKGSKRKYTHANELRSKATESEWDTTEVFFMAEKKKPKYETPVVLSLGEISAGLGQGCTSGSSARGQCGNGNGAIAICRLGADAGAACRIGNGANAACNLGGAPSATCVGGRTA